MSSGGMSRFYKKKIKKAVNAVKRDDVDALKGVLDIFPEFKTMVQQSDGRNLLHLSCMCRKKKVFDYLLNLNCMDLEAVDYDEYTALTQAILYSNDCDYFSVKLIKAGTDIFKIFPEEETYLHFAAEYNLFETAKLLLQKGLDPNAQDCQERTPLHTILHNSSGPKMNECVGLLLEYGADTAIIDHNRLLPFDAAILCRNIKLSIQEHLFYCTFDSHSADYEMPLRLFNRLLDVHDDVSPLLDNVMDIVSDVIFEVYSPVNFFKIPPHFLKKFIERFDYIIRRTFSQMKPDGDMEMNINNIEILLNSELHFETVELISRLDLWRIFSHYYSKECKEELSSLILYLLSHGLNVTAYDCEYIYQLQDYSDLFRTLLLHINDAGISQIGAPMGRIIVDIHCDLNTILARFDDFSCSQIEPLLDHFANSELRLLCESTYEPNLINKIRQLPTVPSLLQLARDETRRHIVRRYNLQKTSQYYWVLRRLLGETNYAEIVSFETKLYG